MTAVRRLANFVDGEWTTPHSQAWAPVTNPATGVAYAEAPVSDAVDVDLACNAAQRAFVTSWGRTTPGARQEALLQLACSLQSEADDLVAQECEQTGKSHAGAHGELEFAIDQLRFFAGAARILEGRAAATYMPGTHSMLRREPVGVVGQVAPWNYPILMAVWKLAPALAAGNTVVLKPSDTTPTTALRIAEIAARHLPPGALNVITGDRSTGRALVAHPVPRMVAITGSTRAGMEVARSAADDVKRLHLELGGKAPVIVFKDADLDQVVDRMRTSGFYNAGQDCTAPTRILVDRSLHDEMVAKLADMASGLKVGGPDTREADLGPLNNPDQLQRVLGIVDRLPDHATVEAGGQARSGAGYFFSPTVISGLKQDDEAIQSEIFGPVVTVQPFDTEEDAIRQANDVPYGLASSLWTRDHARVLRTSAALEFGTVWVNTHRGLVSEMPHGGYKHSGYGCDLSIYSLEEYTRVKHVLSSTE